jgi:hypothetical protein
MSRSFGPFAAFDSIEDYSPVEIVPKGGSEIFRVIRREGRVYQQRFERNSEGKEARLFELEVTHAIGSGSHARTYLHSNKAGELIELPLTWYTQERLWAMSPGYDRAANPRFTRTADAGCLFCHTAYPAASAPYGVRQTWAPGLPAAGVDCRRCHGPGERHIELASAGAAVSQVRQAIVNPASLPRAESLDVCLQCHLQSTSSPLPHAVRRFGRGVFSFQPGQRLSDYLIQFDHPPEAGRNDKFEVNSAGYRLLQSQCSLKSAGRLTCTTCHDPHTDEAVSTKACLGCHPPHQDTRRTDCIGCHMPKRRTEDAIHVVLTDHRIQRGPLQRDPLVPLSETSDAYRGDLRFLQDYSLSSTERLQP